MYDLCVCVHLYVLCVYICKCPLAHTYKDISIRAAYVQRYKYTRSMYSLQLRHTCMCVCMCMCASVYMCVCIYTHIYIHAYIQTYMQHAHIHTYIHTRTQQYMHIPMQGQIMLIHHRHTCSMHTYIHAYIHIYIHTYIQLMLIHHSRNTLSKQWHATVCTHARTYIIIDL
jgi:hypothetical protein